MTAASLLTQDPSLGQSLLLKKIQEHALLSWQNPDRWGRRPAESFSVDDAVLPLDEAGLVTIGGTSFGATHITVTTAGRELAETATPETLCGPLADSEQRAEAALWLWLLLNGGINGEYGSVSHYGEEGEIAHLMLCGLDMKKSSQVRDDTWGVWQGTFADDRRETGVSGYAYCRCDVVEGLTVVHKVESVTALIRAAIGM